MMWYKGVKLSIDGLAQVKKQGAKFKMIFVGEGMDRQDNCRLCGTSGP